MFLPEFLQSSIEQQYNSVRSCIEQYANYVSSDNTSLFLLLWLKSRIQFGLVQKGKCIWNFLNS